MVRNDAALLAEQVRAAAVASGAHVVEGHVHAGGSSTIPQVLMETGAALALIAATKPRVLYVDENLLDYDELLEEAQEALRLDENEKMPASLLAATAALKRHAGEPCSTSVHFVVDSILHYTEASASWMTEFEARLEDLASEAREATDRERQRSREVETARVEELARSLMANPAFRFGKTSAAKRHLLATRMFPGEDDRLLDDVVERAQHLDWLDQSGFNGVAERS
jgi:hypothetical protein